MDFESLSKDQQNKLLSCKTSEDLLAAVSQEGIELTDAQLEQVSGGWDSTESAGTCPFCGSGDTEKRWNGGANPTWYGWCNSCSKGWVTFK